MSSNLLENNIYNQPKTRYQKYNKVYRENTEYREHYNEYMNNFSKEKYKNNEQHREKFKLYAKNKMKELRQKRKEENI